MKPDFEVTFREGKVAITGISTLGIALLSFYLGDSDTAYTVKDTEYLTSFKTWADNATANKCELIFKLT